MWFLFSSVSWSILVCLVQCSVAKGLHLLKRYNMKWCTWHWGEKNITDPMQIGSEYRRTSVQGMFKKWLYLSFSVVFRNGLLRAFKHLERSWIKAVCFIHTGRLFLHKMDNCSAKSIWLECRFLLFSFQYDFYCRLIKLFKTSISLLQGIV